MAATDSNDIISVVGSALLGGSFDGLAGTDTLLLSGGGTFDFTKTSSFVNFEVIQGSSAEDRVVLDAHHLQGLTLIDGGIGGHFDSLTIYGTSIDLTAVEIREFDTISIASDGATVIVDDLATAIRLSAYANGEHLVVNGVNLTEEQRLTLHKKGFDKVTDGTGHQSIDHPPVLTNFPSGTIKLAEGVRTLLFPPGAAVSDDTGRISTITCRIDSLVSGAFDFRATERVSFSVGREGKVFVDNIEIGSFEKDGYYDLHIVFNNSATSELISVLLQSIEYRYSHSSSSASHTITVHVRDQGGRTTTATVEIEPPNAPPTDISLLGPSVSEAAVSGAFISGITGWDPDGDRYLTYSLVDDAGGRFAIEHGRLVVANGSLIDYETAKSHTVVIRATDSGGLTFDKAFVIAVQDVFEPGQQPGAANDRVVGTKAANRLDGRAGDDILFGKLGKDVLTGGAGKDTFVFDTRPGKKNLDRIVDFRPKDDTIQLENKIFKSLGKKTGTLKKSAFWKGKKAHDASDRIVYDKAKGALYYDPDGSGSKAAVQFAKLSNKAALTFKDFDIV